MQTPPTSAATWTLRKDAPSVVWRWFISVNRNINIPAQTLLVTAPRFNIVELLVFKFLLLLLLLERTMLLHVIGSPGVKQLPMQGKY